MTAVFVIAAVLFGTLVGYGLLTGWVVAGLASRDPYAPAQWRWRATTCVLVLLVIGGLWLWVEGLPVRLDSAHALAAARAIFLAPSGA